MPVAFEPDTYSVETLPGVLEPEAGTEGCCCSLLPAEAEAACFEVEASGGGGGG